MRDNSRVVRVIRVIKPNREKISVGRRLRRDRNQERVLMRALRRLNRLDKWIV